MRCLSNTKKLTTQFCSSGLFIYPYIEVLNIDDIHDRFGYEEARKDDFSGFATVYLKACWNENELENNANRDIFKQLMQIDTKFGTTDSELLMECIQYSLRMDLIKVK